jgi:hypothetical protein
MSSASDPCGTRQTRQHGPADQGECGFYARRYLGLRLSTALSCTN